jgi:hypothetical protein
MFRASVLVVLLTVLSACDFEVPGADQKFGTQNFVSAVSIIELHRLRNGSYPLTLKDLEFLGDWAGKPTLVFPEKFKQGLGILETNVKWSSEN